MKVKVDATTVDINVPLVLVSGTNPASNTSTGKAGQISWDTNYFYVCTADDVWKRIPLNADTW